MAAFANYPKTTMAVGKLEILLGKVVKLRDQSDCGTFRVVQNWGLCNNTFNRTI